MLLILLACSLTVVAGVSDEVKLSIAERRFSMELFQEVAANRSYDSVFLSPYSIFNALLTVYVASAGKTEKSMQKFLQFEESLIPSKKYITERLLNETNSTVTKPYELVSVDRIYYTPDIKVKPDKQKIFSEKVAVFTSDDEINNWVSKQTKGVIKKLLEKGSVNPGSAIFTVNAAYFNGTWKKPFIKEKKKKPFIRSDGTTMDTIFMSLTDNNYQSLTDPELGSRILFLPYMGEDIYMIICMPDKPPKKDSPPPIADVVKKLTYTKFQEIVSKLQTQKMCTTDLMLPTYEVEEKYKLKQIFEKLGDKELFTQEMNLTDIFEPGKPIFVDNIIHQANLRMDSNGTEAAAGTVATIPTAEKPECPTTFHADKPFTYIIFDLTHSIVHYTGIYNGKSK